VEPLLIGPGGGDSSAQRRGITLVVNPLVVRLPLEGVVDLAAESQRLCQERDDCARNLDRVSTLVSNPDFRAKARPDVVENQEGRLKSLQEQKQRLDEILAQLSG